MIGIIGYACYTGLGIMTHLMRKNLRIERQLLIPHDVFPFVTKWCEGQFLSEAWNVSFDTLEAWIKEENIGTVVSIESTYGDNTIEWCKRLGVRYILVPMWEWFDPARPGYRNADLYICTSFKTFQEVPFPQQVYLPWPVDTEEIPFIERSGPAKVFIHNAGHGGLRGRKGTVEAVEGFLKADVDAELRIRTQLPLSRLGIKIDDSRIKVIEGSVPHYADLYRDGDVCICCHRYDGQCMVAEEAMCAGLPVITTNAAPMNEFVKTDDPLLVKVKERIPAQVINPNCVANIVDTDDLAEKIRWCAANDMTEISRRNRGIIERSYSWQALRERWVNALR